MCENIEKTKTIQAVDIVENNTISLIEFETILK